MVTKEQSYICLDCQECCKWLDVVWEKERFTDDLKHFYSVRGCKFMEHGRWIHVTMPAICPHLSKELGCTIYEDRPELCRKYDGRNDITMKGICKLAR